MVEGARLESVVYCIFKMFITRLISRLILSYNLKSVSGCP